MGTRYDIECEFAKLDKRINNLNEIITAVRKINPDVLKQAKETIKNKNIKKKGICEHCGNSGASYCVNPYLEELYSETKDEWICESCYDNLLADI